MRDNGRWAPDFLAACLLVARAREVDLYKDLTLKDLRRSKMSANARDIRVFPEQGRHRYP
jgi:hypothetical protein